MSVRLPALKGNALCRFAQRGPCPSGRCERAAKGYGGGRPGAPCEEYGVFRVKETREALRRNLGGTTGFPVPYWEGEPFSFCAGRKHDFRIRSRVKLCSGQD